MKKPGLFFLLLLAASCADDKPPLPPAASPILLIEYPSAIDTLIASYYEAVSGKGKKDWRLLDSVCLPEAQFNAMGINEEGENEWHPGTMRTFKAHMSPYIEASGFYQRELKKDVRHFNRVAQVWSTYETRNDPQGELIDRGIMGFQLVELGGKWKIANVIWNSETPGKRVPEFYLGGKKEH